MPFLEVDGRKIGGSFVIARFLAERFGMHVAVYGVTKIRIFCQIA